MPRKKEGRAAQGAGTIRQRANGSWEGRYTMGRDPATGKQLQKSVYGKTQTEVRRKLAQITVQVDNGTYTEPTRLKVAEWFDIWQRDYTRNLKPSTLLTYRRSINNHIIPALGEVPLMKLSPHAIQHFYNDLLEECSPKTVKNTHGILSKALNQAVALAYIPSNPSSLCTLPKSNKTEIHPLDSDTLPKFLSVCHGDPLENLFVFAVFTGLRRSEIIGLTWDCINFETGTIYIYRQLQPLEGEYQWMATKNGKSRTIAPAPFVMEMLRDIRTRQLEDRLKAGSLWNDQDAFVFTSGTGGHIKAGTLNNHFAKVRNEIELPKLRFHDLRHSYAVASIQAGDDFKTISENMGHHSVAFTMDTYAHVTDAMRKKSSHNMERFYNGLTV